MKGFSARGASNLIEVMTRVPESILKPSSNPDEINLSNAENWVVRNEVLDVLKSAVEKRLQAHILAGVFNTYFQPHAVVEPNHIVVGPGAAACLDAILYNICDPGDGVLVPSPYWNGYDAFFLTPAGIKPISVLVSPFEESFSPNLITALEKRYQNSTCAIKAIVLSNPHNPLGRCYSKNILAQCLKFCEQHEIHLVSDVFALSVFACPDLADPSTFVSALGLDPTLLGCDLERVHVVWSISKDLAASGVRLACIATQNKNLRDAVALVASINVSTLSTVVSKELLASSRLPSLLQLSSRS